MPFEPDANVAMQYGGALPPTQSSVSGFVPDPTMSKFAPKPKSTSLLGRLANAMWQPINDYGEMGAEALYQSGKMLLNKNYRNAVQKVNSGQELTPAEAQYILKQKSLPLGIGMEQDDFQKFGGAAPLSAETWKKGLLEGTKRTAGMEAYLAPSLLGVGAGGGLAYMGGAPATQALLGGGVAAPAVMKEVARQVGKQAALGAGRGAISGGLLGFSQSETGQELPATLAGTAFGGAVGAGMGAAGAKIAQGGDVVKAKAQAIYQEKLKKPVDKIAVKMLSYLLRTPRRKAWAELSGFDTAKGLLEQGADPTRYKTMDDWKMASEAIINELDGAVDETLFRSPDTLVQTSGIQDALSRELSGRNISDKSKKQVIQSVMEAIGKPIGNFDDMFADDFLQSSVGLTKTEMELAKAAINQTAIQTSGVSGQTPAQLLTGKLVANGFDPDEAGLIAQWYSTARTAPPGQAHLWDLRKIDQLLGENATDAYRQWDYSRSADDKAVFEAYKAASQETKRLLDLATDEMDPLISAITPERIARLNALADGMGDRFAQSARVGAWRRMMAPFVQLKNIVRIQEKMGKSLFEGSLERGAGSLVGALAGSTLGGPVGSVLGVAGGALLGPLLAPVAETGFERAAVPIAGAASRFAQSAAAGGLTAMSGRALGGAIGGVGRTLLKPLAQSLGVAALNEIRNPLQLQKVEQYNRSLPTPPLPVDTSITPSPYDMIGNISGAEGMTQEELQQIIDENQLQQ